MTAFASIFLRVCNVCICTTLFCFFLKISQYNVWISQKCFDHCNRFEEWRISLFNLHFLNVVLIKWEKKKLIKLLPCSDSRSWLHKHLSVSNAISHSWYSSMSDIKLSGTMLGLNFRGKSYCANSSFYMLHLIQRNNSLSFMLHLFQSSLDKVLIWSDKKNAV